MTSTGSSAGRSCIGLLTAILAGLYSGLIRLFNALFVGRHRAVVGDARSS